MSKAMNPETQTPELHDPNLPLHTPNVLKGDGSERSEGRIWPRIVDFAGAWCRCVGFGFWGFRAAEVQPICRASDPYSRSSGQRRPARSPPAFATFNRHLRRLFQGLQGLKYSQTSARILNAYEPTPNSPKLEALDPILQALRLKDHVVHHVSKTITFVRLKDASGSVEGLHLGGSCFLLGLLLDFGRKLNPLL